MSIKIIIFILYSYLNIFKNFLLNIKKLSHLIGDWGLGIGDWGLGIGGLAQNPNPQTPNPKPQTPNPKFYILII